MAMWGVGDDNPDEFDFKVAKESEVRRFLRGARPSWAPKDLEKVELKLSKIGIKTLDKFKASLNPEAEPGLNPQLQAKGEKGFAVETLAALRGQIDKPLPEAQMVLNRKQVVAPSPPPAPVVVAKIPEVEADAAPARPPPQSEPEAPPARAQQFEVIVTNVPVHNRPDDEAQWLGRRMEGQSVWGEEETFDGWVKLSSNKGWVRRARLLQDGKTFEDLLKPVGEMPPLPSWEMSERPGLRMFQVVFSPHVPVRSAPSSDAAPVSVKKVGDLVAAETQRYDGWVRLADGKGWMRSFSEEDGPLLMCSYFEHLPSWNETVRLAKMSSNPTNENIVKQAIKESFYREFGRDPADIQMLRGAIMGAKAMPNTVPRADIKSAELRAEALRWGKGSVVTEAAQPTEDEKREKSMAEARKFAVDNLAVVVNAGDPDAIKEAIERAKDLGVPKKEIARMYALANGNINLADR